MSPAQWKYAREIIAARRERARLEQSGFTYHEPIWEIVRGGHWRRVILEVRISKSGKGLWIRTGEPT